MGDQQIEVTSSVIGQMKQHAREERPHEACALLFGDNGRVEGYHAMTNLNEGLEELTKINGIDDDSMGRLRDRLSLNDKAGKLNVNEATEDELAAVDGISEEAAQKIVDRRQRIGRFEDPTVHFKFDPGEHAQAQMKARKQDRGIIGVYHSHPDHDSEAYPSEEDQDMGHGGYIYFILNFQPDETIINAFEFVDDAVEERSFTVT